MLRHTGSNQPHVGLGQRARKPGQIKQLAISADSGPCELVGAMEYFGGRHRDLADGGNQPFGMCNRPFDSHRLPPNVNPDGCPPAGKRYHENPKLDIVRANRFSIVPGVMASKS